MDKRVGTTLLALSAAGYPATQYVIRRFGRTGAAITELVCVGLLIRDGVMLARGTHKVLRTGPATLLWLECGVAAVASASNTPTLTDSRAGGRVEGCPGDAAERVRRAAIAILFALHTIRLRVYLRPDRGLRCAQQ
jgi:hypothetical protein